VALVAEGTSLLRALYQVRAQARANGRRFREELRAAEDPSLRTVLAEDSTAVLGVVLALAGVGLHMATGERRWEAYASIGIAVLLMYVAYRLGKDSRDSLIGEAADPALSRQVHELLLSQPEIDTVTALLTMRLGLESTLLAARVDLSPGIESEKLERALVRVKRTIAEKYPVFDQIFLDIVDVDSDTGDRQAADRLRKALDHAADTSDEDVVRK
jgi:cation diffusion facilitator family transporter